MTNTTANETETNVRASLQAGIDKTYGPDYFEVTEFRPLQKGEQYVRYDAGMYLTSRAESDPYTVGWALTPGLAQLSKQELIDKVKELATDLDICEDDYSVLDEANDDLKDDNDQLRNDRAELVDALDKTTKSFEFALGRVIFSNPGEFRADVIRMLAQDVPPSDTIIN
jgi:hypothetical protein